MGRQDTTPSSAAARVVLIVDDERAVREGLGEALQNSGFSVVLADGVDEALRQLETQRIRAVLSDLRMPGADGLELLKAVQKCYPGIPFVLMTAYASVETAVEALKLGASDYLLKPILLDGLIACIERLLALEQLTRENRLLRQELDRWVEEELHVGSSEVMVRVVSAVNRVAPTSATVLLSGESGTGKDLLARAVHRRSPLADRPFVVVDLGAIPEVGLESQLFGSVQVTPEGPLTHDGLFQSADGGTLFLDEIGNLSLEAQSKLLRAIEGGEILPVGGSRPIRTTVRVIAATHCDLEDAVAKGTFRQDLYYRLNVFGIRVPPLRERREDIPGLARFLLNRLNRRLKASYGAVEKAALLQLVDHDWPGNVRELRNVLERSMILGDGKVLRPADLPFELKSEPAPERINLKQAVREFERVHITGVLLASDWSRKQAAERLGISTTSLWRRMTDLGIETTTGGERSSRPDEAAPPRRAD